MLGTIMFRSVAWLDLAGTAGCEGALCFVDDISRFARDIATHATVWDKIRVSSAAIEIRTRSLVKMPEVDLSKRVKVGEKTSDQPMTAP